MTKELPEIFEEEMDEQEDAEVIRARNQLYDALHSLEKMIGHKGLVIILFIIWMLFWLPMWLRLLVNRLVSR
ncbi:hypothetical protein [Paenibacillus hamazuiensis]|uniref:hypothetical protein n=1 Tax=Paenibacillus hamazuiensis TaxID=2936508 RepID=UPI00200C058F|nr:hypothetical protein [Paenibacillus hamazuiensis]